MKILVCGDSWTEGYGVKPNETWLNFIGHEFVSTARCGASNEEIVEQFLKTYDNTFDAVVIGWSGITRFRVNDRMNEFSLVDDKTIEFFENISLSNILKTWDSYIQTILSKSSVPVIQYSVFGDIPKIKYDNFLETSYLDFLANKSGVFFKHSIPMFEFDWLNKENYRLTKPFADKYFDKDWERACVEREEIRPSKYFLECGHPNPEGHKLWAQHIKGVLDDIFSK